MGTNEQGSARISEMVGVVMREVTGETGGDEMVFRAESGNGWRFYHLQDCCERVDIVDICGDLQDLVGSPLLLAEEVGSADAAPPADLSDESYTWTFYKFATNKGAVTVRWLGESNGYYGEEVDFERL